MFAPSSRTSLVNLGRKKHLKYQRPPSQDRSGESVLESNLLKKNQERNGERRSPKMYGRLEDCSRKMKGTWSAPTTRSRLNGRRSCEKSYSLWRAVGLVKRRMESCIRREDLDGSSGRPENSKVSTSPWSGTMESGWYGKARKLKEDRNRSTTSIVTLSEGERWRKFRSTESSTRYWGLYPRTRVCAQFVGLRATGKVDVSSRIWFSNYGNRLRWYWCQPNDYASTTLAGISYANGTSMRKNFQYFYLAIAFADYGAVSSQISEINSKRYKDAKLRSPEEYPEIEPPEDEREERPVLSTAQAMEYAASKKAAKPSDPEQRMASHSETLLDMQDQAKKRRAKLLEKESKQKAIDVDDESTSKKEESASKKARGKGQGSESGIWTKEPLPAGHWQAFLRKAKKPRMPYARDWKPTGKNNSRNITRRSCGKPSTPTSRRKPVARRKNQQLRKDPAQMKRDRIPAVRKRASRQVRPMTLMVLRTWSRLVQKLLRRVPERVLNQSKGKMPFVALGLLLQLVINCAKFGQNCTRKTQKDVQSCTCMRRKVNRMHSIRWRRRVSNCKRSIKLFVFTLLIVRTEAMEAAGSPGSIGAEVPPVASHMQPVPDDGLGMTV